MQISLTRKEKNIIKFIAVVLVAWHSITLGVDLFNLWHSLKRFKELPLLPDYASKYVILSMIPFWLVHLFAFFAAFLLFMGKRLGWMFTIACCIVCIFKLMHVLGSANLNGSFSFVIVPLCYLIIIVILLMIGKKNNFTLTRKEWFLMILPIIFLLGIHILVYY